MKIKDKVKGLNYKIEFIALPSELEKHFDEQLKKIAPQIKEKGFREGHVPEAVIRQKYGQQIKADAVDALINEALSAYIKDKKLMPALRPEVKMDKFEDGKDIEFSVEFDVLPEIKDIDFKGIEVKKEVEKITDKEIEKSLEQIRDGRCTFVAVKEDRPVKKGDTAVINFEGFLDGVAFDGGKAENHHLEIGSGQFIPGFEDGLIGAVKGQELDVPCSFPKEYHATNLAGKKVNFKVKVNEIQEKQLPELDDKFAQGLGRKDLADLKSYIKELMENKAEQDANVKMQDKILEILDKKTKFDLPESLVNQELKYMMSQDKNLAEKDARKQAEQRVKLGLLIGQIGKKAGIVVENLELENIIKMEASRYPGQEKMVIEYYQKNPMSIETIRGQLFEKKTFDWILTQIKVI